MGDMADWAYDQALEEEMEWHFHQHGRCGPDCPWCWEEHFKDKEIQELKEDNDTN